MNISKVSNDKTARTNTDSAQQRAENLSILGSKNVLELCCGPSLKTLELAYKKYNINCTGNDIEERWKDYYPDGKWLIGNCFDINYNKFDTIVFAPPLSLGCTGKRINSLSINDVNPSYYEFLRVTEHFKGIRVLVLPAKSIKTNYDKKQFYELIYKLNCKYDIVPLTEGRRFITKYVDVYLIN